MRRVLLVLEGINEAGTPMPVKHFHFTWSRSISVHVVFLCMAWWLCFQVVSQIANILVWHHKLVNRIVHQRVKIVIIIWSFSILLFNPLEAFVIQRRMCCPFNQGGFRLIIKVLTLMNSARVYNLIIATVLQILCHSVRIQPLFIVRGNICRSQYLGRLHFFIRILAACLGRAANHIDDFS